MPQPTPPGPLMGPAERTAVMLALLPLVAGGPFLVCWWGCAALHLAGVLAEPAIPVSAFAGLAIGLAAAAVLLPQLADSVYRAPWWLVGGAYLFWTAAALALLMGVPLGSLAVGMAAGAYAGRRWRWQGAGNVPAAMRRVARLTTVTMAACCAAMLAVVLVDPYGRASVAQMLGLPATPSLAGTVALLVAGSAALAAAQYWLTLRAAAWGYGRPT